MTASDPERSVQRAPRGAVATGWLARPTVYGPAMPAAQPTIVATSIGFSGEGHNPLNLTCGPSYSYAVSLRGPAAIRECA